MRACGIVCVEQPVVLRACVRACGIVCVEQPVVYRVCSVVWCVVYV